MSAAGLLRPLPPRLRFWLLCCRYVSPQDWPSERYPPWAHGTGYVLTADIVQEIAAGRDSRQGVVHAGSPHAWVVGVAMSM